MSELFISFVIPCYHSGETINEAIDSIFKAVQGIVSFEIIVVAENEQDDTFQYIDKRYSNHVFKFYSHYPGVTANRNTGLQNAKGKYVYFLDSDDILVVGDWVHMIYLIQDNCSVDVFFGKTKNFNEKSSYFQEHKNSILLSKNDLDSFYGNDELVSFSYCSYIFRRLFLTQNNVYVDKTIKNAEDYLFVGLFLSNNPKMYITDLSLNEYVKRKESLSNKYDLTTALSYINSFSRLFILLEDNDFVLSLNRFRMNFVCVNLDIGYKISKNDRDIFLQFLRENNILKNVIKKCPNCNKKKLYLVFGFKIGWKILKFIHFMKGI